MTIKKNFIDPVLQEIERSLQKARLRRRIRQSIREEKRFFKSYLNNGFTLSELTQQQQTLKNKIEEHFKGKSQEALSQHIWENIQSSRQINKQFNKFTRYF